MVLTLARKRQGWPQEQPVPQNLTTQVPITPDKNISTTEVPWSRAHDVFRRGKWTRHRRRQSLSLWSCMSNCCIEQSGAAGCLAYRMAVTLVLHIEWHWSQHHWPSLAERTDSRGIVQDMAANGFDWSFGWGCELPLQECPCTCSQGAPLEMPLAAGRD